MDTCEFVVPGLAAKPIIDIMVGVASPALLDVRAEPESTPGDGQNVTPAGPQEHVRVVEAIKTLGYAYQGENTIPGRPALPHPYGADGLTFLERTPRVS